MGKFYTLNQNNSGGYDIQDENVDRFVIIEAENLEQFKIIAETIFMNYRSYCPCCGERWPDGWVDEDDAKDEPMIYEEPIEQYYDRFWSRNAKVKIYYLNGNKKTYNLETRMYV